MITLKSIFSDIESKVHHTIEIMKSISKYLFLCLLLLSCFTILTAQEKEMTITMRYLNLPVSHKNEKKRLVIESDNHKSRSFPIRLAETNPDYWVFCDMNSYMGEKVTISYPSQNSLNFIYQDNQIAGSDNLYKEKNRPQFHFSSMRGWINDPNGLVYYDGEYHLFYQHYPFDRNGADKHWGHAVSKDLIHWEELPTALYPDELGNMFSGSAVIDYKNTAGFNQNGQPAMIAIYTATTSKKQVQCIAYSLDKGRTWTKYAGNPVVDSQAQWNSIHTRDPKVFWHNNTKQWIMILHERDGFSIYNSKDLKIWTYQSHVTGFWECPEFFELPVDGNPKNTRWIMCGASGNYMIGEFDGKKFTPESGKHYYTSGTGYAGQTFNNIEPSDGRRIQISWGRIRTNDMPFNGLMLLPTELTLRNTKHGARLFSYPVKEVNKLTKEKFTEKNLTVQKANEFLQKFNKEPLLRVKFDLKLSHSTGVRLSLHGQTLFHYNLNTNLLNNVFYSPNDMTSMEISVDLFLDKTSIEGFVDNGAYSYSEKRVPKNVNQGFNFIGDNEFEIKNLEVSTLHSIWNNYQF